MASNPQQPATAAGSWSNARRLKYLSLFLLLVLLTIGVVVVWPLQEGDGRMLATGLAAIFGAAVGGATLAFSWSSVQ